MLTLGALRDRRDVRDRGEPLGGDFRNERLAFADSDIRLVTKWRYRTKAVGVSANEPQIFWGTLHGAAAKVGAFPPSWGF